MTQSFYDQKPSVVEKYDGKSDMVNLNITEVVVEHPEGEPTTGYKVDTIIVEHPATYASVVDALVREEYSVSDELAILRQRDIKEEEFARYNAFVEDCKKVASVVKRYI